MSIRSERTSRLRRLPTTGSGFILPAALWAVYFISIYAVQGAGCSGVPREVEGLRLTLIAMFVASAVLMAGFGLWSYRSWRALRNDERREAVRPELAPFLALGGALQAALFFVAILWIGVPTLFLDPCQGHLVHS